MKERKTISFQFYYLLKQKPHTINELFEYVKAKGVNISKRSLYRHLQKIEGAIDTLTEVFETETGKNNQKTFLIRSVVKQEEREQSEWVEILDKLMIFENTIPSWLLAGSPVSRYIEDSSKKAPLKARMVALGSGSRDTFVSTRFGELIYNQKQRDNFTTILYGLQNNSCFQINRYNPLTTREYFRLPEIKTPLVPLKVWYHRGNYAISCHYPGKPDVYTIELDMIDSLSISGYQQSGLEVAVVLPDFLENSFGYHPPLKDKVYEIKLQFPPTPGGHIMMRQWHAGQAFRKMHNGNIIMTFKSAVTIELLGWIMVWMDNVKVLAPRILKTMIRERLGVMMQIIDNDLDSVNNRG